MTGKRTLVLGGGGPVGIAWESGLAAGLAAEGVVIADADFIVGTSAGSLVGAQLASGRSAQSLAEAQMALAAREHEASAKSEPGEKRPGKAPDLAPLVQMMAKAPMGSETPEALLAELGAYARSSQTMSEAQFIAGFGWIAEERTPFPARYACTAVDAESGAFRTWRAEDGAPLGRGIASSCSVPGIFPPIAIHGRVYMDGGMRSPTNADLAAGYERVLVVAVTIGAFADFMRQRMQWELDAITRAGGRVEAITPDANALEAFGTNLMDSSRRGQIAEAGMAQGRAEAGRIKAFWN